MQEIIKAAKGEYKDVDIKKGEGVVAFATYNTPDRDGDIANKGMFTKSWNDFKDVRLFKNHDKNLAPGRILKLYEDDNHAYAHFKMGSSTLGQDTLKDIDEGIIQDSSYMFIPQKYKALDSGGSSYTEVFHKEVSVLTHWGAHPQSKIKAIRKAWQDMQVSNEVLKELSSDEVMQLKIYIANFMGSLQNMVGFAANLQPTSEMYTRIHSMINTTNSAIADFKYWIHWYGPKEKSWEDIKNRVEKLKSYCNKSTASDEHIQELQKEAEALSALLSNVETVGTQSSWQSTQEQHKGESIDKATELQLLNLSMLLDGDR